MRRAKTPTLLAACLLIAAVSPGQDQPAPAADAPRFQAGAERVTVDLVVRDKRGKLVTDLEAGEVTVLEDGVPQKIVSFRAVGPAAAGGDAAAAVPVAPSAAGATPSLSAADKGARSVTMVFGRLGAEGRRLAQSAGDEFLKKHLAPGTLVTVLRFDGSLVPLVERTSDATALKDAVHRATGRAVDGGIRAAGPTGADNSYAGQQMGRFAGGAGARDLSQTDSIGLVSALVGVVETLARDPGRKAVLLFTEGMVVPPGYEHVFADLQSRANRANVAFYGLDVRGLQLSSQLGSSGAALATTAAISEQQRQAGSAAPATRDQMTQDDAMQASLHSDVVDALGNLSSSTGGFLVAQTNDFSRPLARIAEDLRGYYELSYVPSVPPEPGQFRRIEVRLSRRDTRVQSRSGYYTTPGGAPSAEAFDVLAAPEPPKDFEVRSQFYRFAPVQGAAGAAFDCLVKLEASLAEIDFQPDPQGRLAGRLVLAGRVLDGAGKVVEAFGQDVALGGSQEQVSAARQQMFPLARRLVLPPGSYNLELVVRDPKGRKTSAHRVPVTVPPSQGDLAMSSLIVVAALDPVDAKSDPTDPLRLGDQRIVPNLGAPVAPAAGAVLPVYYNVYVAPGTTEAVAATVEVQHAGRLVARGSSPLPAPDEAGRITGLSPIPLQKLTGGTYQVRVSVSKGAVSVSETASVTVAP